MPIVIQPLARLSTNFNDQMYELRNQQSVLASEMTNVYVGPDLYDLAMQDSAHFAAGTTGYDTASDRIVQTVKHAVGVSAVWRGPQVTGGALNGSNNIDLTVAYPTGSDDTDIVVPSGAIGFEVEDGAVSKTVSSISRIDANTIRITVSGDPLTGGDVAVKYRVFRTDQDRTKFIKGNNGYPLSVFTDITNI